MINKLFFFSVLLFVESTFATTSDNQYFSLDSDIICMVQSYDGAKNNNKADVHKFLSCFPTDYRQYSAIFGYGGGAFQNKSMFKNNEVIYSYVDLFFKLKIEQEEYKNIFSIALNGHWEVDAVGYYKHKLTSFMKEYPKITAVELEKLGQKELYGFWFFYFDGPYLAKVIPNEIIVLGSYSSVVEQSAQNVFSYFQEVNLPNKN